MRTLQSIFRPAAAGIILAILLSGCGGGGSPQYPISTALPLPTFSVTFQVRSPEDTPQGDKVVLNILDEVTGLSLNPSSYEMNAVDTNLWRLSLDFPRGSVLYYRYSLESGPLESAAGPATIDYRVYFTAGNNQVEDTIAHWAGTDFHGTTGRIRGLVRDSATGLAIPGLLISAAGMTVQTDTSGNYLLSGVPTGKQNLVAYDMNGGYRVFLQEAIVADGQDTPANLLLTPVPRVTISFHLYVPPDTPPGATVRVVGNLFSLGNTFQSGPASTMVDAARAPEMTQLVDGTYLASLSLPMDAYVRYKFTMGDGFWNAERDTQGRMILHDMIVPEHDTLVENGVVSWHSGTNGPVTFNVATPPSTPTNEYIAIQFSPFQGIWMRPIPMRNTGPQQWTYMLYNPLEWPGIVAYRYCRNGNCGVADDAATAGDHPGGRQFTPSPTPQIVSDTVLEWVALGDTAAPAIPAAPVIKSDFRFGVLFSPAAWSPPYTSATSDLTSLRAGNAIISPLWYLGANAPVPEIRFLPELASPNRTDLLTQTGTLRAAGIQPSFAPDLTALTGTTNDWWETAPRDGLWWNSFFEQYQAFLYTYADIAQQTGASELFVARVNVSQALPNQPNTPADADTRWRVLVRNIRLRYAGKIAVELPLTDSFTAPPAFLDEVDEIFIRMSGPLTTGGSAPDAMQAAAGTLLDDKLTPVRALGKTVYIEAAYPSIAGAEGGCLTDPSNACLPLDVLTPGPGLALTLTPNFDSQTSAYQALLSAAAARDWIAGFFAWDYYTPAAMRDASPSIHGKPVEALLSAWFTR